MVGGHKEMNLQLDGRVGQQAMTSSPSMATWLVIETDSLPRCRRSVRA
jgi:hypothetical protein